MKNKNNESQNSEFLELKARLGLQFLLANYRVDEAPEGMLDEYMEMVVGSPNPQEVLAEYFESFAVRNAASAGITVNRERAVELLVDMNTPMSYSDLAALLWEMTFPGFDEKDTIRTIFGNDAL